MMDAERRHELDLEHFENSKYENDRKHCPTCGRDESYFTTSIVGEEGWQTICKCGELIDED
jgi:hypothetical protein